MKKLLLLLVFLHIVPMAHAMNYDIQPRKRAKKTAARPSSNLEKLRSLHGDRNWTKRKALFKLIIGENPLDVDIHGYGGDTALSQSLLFGDVSFTLFLLHHKADPNKKNYEGKAPLYEIICNLNLIIKNAGPQPNRNIGLQEQLVRLLICNDANPDLETNVKENYYLPVAKKTARGIAIPQIMTLIEQAEREKQIRRYLVQEYLPTVALVTDHLPLELSYLVTNYLNENLKTNNTEIAQIEADMRAESAMIESEKYQR